jgi:hypothetical protein
VKKHSGGLGCKLLVFRIHHKQNLSTGIWHSFRLVTALDWH